MILTLIEVVLPVFLVIGAGYLAVVGKLFTTDHADGLMAFAQKFAVPSLLFINISRLDLGAYFDWRLMVSFYTGAIIAFAIAIALARTVFKRRPGDAVAVGFGAMFSNSLLLGIPITERAYGADALAANFAIISIHAPLLFTLGIVAMEAARSDGRGLSSTLTAILRSIFQNSLMIGIALGFIVNLSGLPLPGTLSSAIDMIARTALPAALFALGGTLTRYQLKASLGEAGMITILSLLFHPTLTWLLSTQVFELSQAFVRSAVLTSAMAPGVNAYVFASMYNRAKGAAASAVLMATALSIFTITFWLWFLG